MGDRLQGPKMLPRFTSFRSSTECRVKHGGLRLAFSCHSATVPTVNGKCKGDDDNNGMQFLKQHHSTSISPNSIPTAASARHVASTLSLALAAGRSRLSLRPSRCRHNFIY